MRKSTVAKLNKVGLTELVMKFDVFLLDDLYRVRA